MRSLRRILIAGGGSSGWMTAALLSKLFRGLYDITLVESEDIGIIGVGEATIPAIKKYLEILGLNEKEFMQGTQGTFKMGIQFNNWGQVGDSYLHGFGVIGQELEWLRMHHYWLKARENGWAEKFDSYSINAIGALENKFMHARADMAESPLGHIGYAYHFDAGLFARFLSGFAQNNGVRRREGKIVDVRLNPENGHVSSLLLESGETISGELFMSRRTAGQQRVLAVHLSNGSSLLLSKSLAPTEAVMNRLRGVLLAVGGINAAALT